MRKLSLTIFLLTACLTMIVGITAAYFTDQTGVSEIFSKTGKLDIDLHVSSRNGWSGWKPGDINAKELTWTITNNGDNSACVKVAFNSFWVKKKLQKDYKADGAYRNVTTQFDTVIDKVYSLQNASNVIDLILPAGEPDVTWKSINNDKWEERMDGYWYYLNILHPGEKASISFALSLNKIGGDYLGAQYSITVNADAIQADNNAIHNDPEWNVTN